ncbi:MAG: hypothetical protein FJ390_07045 [Verrucomicrobia bacterium]|nr:hypothetical protein [Verrucomicrobiota bacterium]
MNTYPLTEFNDWNDFDRIACLLQRNGWIVEKKIDGPDALICLLTHNGTEVWLVFDDILGYSLKNEHSLSELKLIAKELSNSFLESEKMEIDCRVSV